MQRWIIEISEYAVVDYPEAWGEWRNPVKYTTLVAGKSTGSTNNRATELKYPILG
jgi:hypothetical protein